MSLQWSLIPLFFLAAAMAAWARWPNTESPPTCWLLAGVFFGLGVSGLSIDMGPAAALGTGILYMLIGLPLASVVLALWGLRSGAAPGEQSPFMASGQACAR